MAPVPSRLLRVARPKAALQKTPRLSNKPCGSPKTLRLSKNSAAPAICRPAIEAVELRVVANEQITLHNQLRYFYAAVRTGSRLTIVLLTGFGLAMDAGGIHSMESTAEEK